VLRGGCVFLGALQLDGRLLLVLVLVHLLLQVLDQVLELLLGLESILCCCRNLHIDI
jgi:hypothetical protein